MRPARRQRFWLISGGVHLAALVALILSPVGEHIFRRDIPERPEVVRHGSGLSRVVDDIRDLTAERLRAQVALLEAGQQRMATNFTVLNAHYQPRADVQAAVARERFAEQAEEALTRQRAVLTAATTVAADPDSAGIMAAILGEHQARVTTGLEEIRRGVHLLASDRTDLIDELRAVEEQQLEAFQHLRWVRDNHHGIQRHRDRIGVITKELADIATELATIEEALTAADTALTTARQVQAEAADDRARRAANKRVSDAERAQRDARTRKERATTRRDRLTGESTQIANRITGQIANREKHAGTALQLQTAATTRQSAVVDAVHAILATETTP